MSDLFPRRRADGSCSVAIRLRLPAVPTEAELAAYIAVWMKEKAEQGIDVLVDLASEPYIVIRGEETLDIVFDGKPNALHWKDWLVDLAVHLPPDVKQSRKCFYDLVARRAQPTWGG